MLNATTLYILIALGDHLLREIILYYCFSRMIIEVYLRIFLDHNKSNHKNHSKIGCKNKLDVIDIYSLQNKCVQMQNKCVNAVHLSIVYHQSLN